MIFTLYIDSDAVILSYTSLKNYKLISRKYFGGYGRRVLLFST